MLTLFDILKDINLNKSYTLYNHEEFDKQYNDFMINRFLSMSPETVLEANFMNIFNNIPKKSKYLFLTDIVERKDRFLKYAKPNSESNTKLIECLQNLYYVNKNEAMLISETITEEEKKRVIKNYDIIKKSVKK